MRYFTWKLELVSDILWVIVGFDTLLVAKYQNLQKIDAAIFEVIVTYYSQDIYKKKVTTTGGTTT